MLRMMSIQASLKKRLTQRVDIYFDIGCSNGYLTNVVSSAINAEKTTGFDIIDENLIKARELYPNFTFLRVNLNEPLTFDQQADFVTCFETLEHVGNVHVALQNIRNALRPGGHAFLSVPIESSVRGAIKYFIKTHLFKYSLDELTADSREQKAYVRALVTGRDIGVFRQEGRAGWATHFGFDYRNVERLVRQQFSDVIAWTSVTSRFLWFRR